MKDQATAWARCQALSRTQQIPANLRATAIGLHATIVGIGLLPASLIAGQLWGRLGPAATFYFGGGMGLVAAVGLLLVL